MKKLIRDIVKKNPGLKLKLKKADSKLTPFQYVYQSITMTIFSTIALFVLVYLISKKDLMIMLLGSAIVILLSPLLYKFWFGFVDVQIRKAGRELDGDLLFVSEYFMVSLESGLPLGNAIQNFSRLNRPGGRFFKRLYVDFKTGKDLSTALEDASMYSPSDLLRVLLKRLKDSLDVGIDLKDVFENFIEEASEKKVVEIRGYSKKLNPVIMMYLLLGVVIPSLGITFFILGASMMDMGPELLKYILIFVFLAMFGIQYFAYSAFKFSKSTI